ncbi:hypothetical protein SK128_002605, partial [Halocaridina rubra]
IGREPLGQPAGIEVLQGKGTNQTGVSEGEQIRRNFTGDKQLFNFTGDKPG